MQNKENVQLAEEFILKRAGDFAPARLGIVLGTGLGGFCDAFDEDFALPYAEIPDFPRSTVQSHAGTLSLGRVAGVPVWILRGRFHLYEGYTPAEVCMGVRTLAALGVTTLLLTNAAGALNPQFQAGGLMCISDQINLTGESPLTGPNVDAWGPRFPDMSKVYSPELRDLALRTALELGIALERGVYVGVRGPNMETPAETRAYRILGADAIGMSTVLEAIAAHHMGLALLGVSCLTNKNLPDCMEETSLENVIAMAAQAGGRLSRLLEAVVARIGDNGQ